MESNVPNRKFRLEFRTLGHHEIKKTLGFPLRATYSKGDNQINKPSILGVDYPTLHHMMWQTNSNRVSPPSAGHHYTEPGSGCQKVGDPGR